MALFINGKRVRPKWIEEMEASYFTPARLAKMKIEAEQRAVEWIAQRDAFEAAGGTLETAEDRKWNAIWRDESKRREGFIS